MVVGAHGNFAGVFINFHAFQRFAYFGRVGGFRLFHRFG